MQTTDATVTDYEMTDSVHTGLAGKGLLPAVHLVDAGYVTARQLVASRDQHQIDLVGPVIPDTSRQTSEAAGCSLTDFQIDWHTKKSPAHKASAVSGDPPRTTNASIRSSSSVRRQRLPTLPRPTVLHPRTQPRPRPATAAPRGTRDSRPRPHEQKTPAWQEKYRPRAGIEGTISHAVRRVGVRRARYHGLPKTRLQHHLAATALNHIRIDNWLTNTPLATTRTSHFAALKPAA